MERASSKHSPVVDEEMAREAEAYTRGRPAGSRAEEFRDPEPAGEEQPEPTVIHGEHPQGAPSPLTGEELNARSDFGRWIPRSALPGTRDELVRGADTLDAPAEVLAQLQSLPAERRYETVYEVWEALGHRNEDDSSGEMGHDGPRHAGGEPGRGEPTG